MGRPSRPILGLLGQTNVGVSGSGGEPFPKPLKNGKTTLYIFY